MKTIWRICFVLALVVGLAAVLAPWTEAEEEPVVVCTPANLLFQGSQSTATTVTITLDNPETTPESGWVVADVTVGGNPETLGFPVTDAPEESIVDATYAVMDVTVVGATVCATLPNGIIEAPEPIAVSSKPRNGSGENEL